MKVFFITFSTIHTPHFETEMELMYKHLLDKDDVYSIHCSEVLNNCSPHPIKIKGNCYHCKKKYSKSINFLNKQKKINLIYLNKDIKIPDNINYNFKDVNELKKYKYDDIDIGMAVASSLISILRDHNFDTIGNSEIVKNMISTSIKMYLLIKQIFNENKPDLVYVFNGRFAESRPIVRLCQKENINFYTHERGGDISRYELFKNTIPHDFSYISKQIDLYWEKKQDEEYKVKISSDWFQKRKDGIQTSWLSFVKDQDKNLLPSNFDKNKFNIIIFNSSEDEFSAIDVDNHKMFKEQEDAINEIVKYFKNNKDINIYLRVHPNLSNLNNTQTKNIDNLLQSDNFTIIKANSKISTYSLIKNSNLIITFGSTVGIEAVFYNKASILIGDSIYKDLDSVYIPETIDKLFNLILSKPKAKNKLGALKYGYWETTHGYKFKYFEPSGLFDGKFLGQKIDLNMFEIFIRKSLVLYYKLSLILKK